jgi:3-deoxy-manno-octulosonate cytidylyltransferase (CMP-KDO synthetase)
MLKGQRIACIIPARLLSSRFPKKVLATLQGKPLLQWVWESAVSIPFFDEVAFALDAEETAALVSSFGGKFYMTSVQCPSGTDRLIEVMQKQGVQADLFVNWQGDEPFICQAMIEDLLQSCHDRMSDLWTLKKQIILPQEIESPHHVKVVSDDKGFALYFSRSPIPHYRDGVPPDGKPYFKHVGLYAYRREALEKIAQLSPCTIEKAEQLEQLRWLYNGLKIQVHETQHESLGIDLPEHLAKADARIENNRWSGV